MSAPSSKEAVALSSIFASVAMVAMKLVVGLLTGSLGILSEAAHSGLDVGAATLTWAAVRVSDKPADENHPYGHGKFESLSALVGTALLILTAVGVAREAILNLMEPAHPVEITWYGVAVIVISMVIDFARSRALARAARETGSQALEADALHFSTDILSSLVVLLGLGGVWVGYPKADAIAALGVSLFIAHAGWELGRRTLDVLVDTAPEGINDRIRAAISGIDGVARVDWIRARPGGTTLFADIGIKVSRTLSLEQVEAVRATVAKTVNTTIGDIQALVVAEPLALDTESVSQTVQVLAGAKDLTVHSVEVASVDGQHHVSLHMEVEADETIAAAHAVAAEFETALHRELGHDVVLDVHIDPKRSRIFYGTSVTGALLDTVHHAVSDIVSHNHLVTGFHNLVVQAREDGLYVSCHCLFPDQTPMLDVHEEAEKIEFALLRSVPGVTTVVVHAEPLSHPEEGHMEDARHANVCTG